MVVFGSDIKQRKGDTISFKNISGEAMLILLDGKEIYCSSGSACSSGELESSETLKWLNYIDGTLRFSFD